MTDLDLFGERSRPMRKGPQAKGYAARPGSGPKDQTCGSCRHCFRKTYTSKPVFKCLLMRDDWGQTRRTDILFRATACKFWEAKNDE